MQGSKVLGDETAAMYERAITGIMKHSMLLYFAYADFEEVKKKSYLTIWLLEKPL